MLLNRWDVSKSYREKEWWFSYLYDPERQVYFSWAFVRVFWTERVRFWFVDLREGRTWNFERDLAFAPPERPGQLDLSYRGRDFEVSFQGDPRGTARLHLTDPRFRIHLDITRSPTPFTRRDNFFSNHYFLLHHFQDHVRGTLELDGHRYEVDTRHSYYDHCYGVLPSKTAWHWVAVQNGELALASLRNYGPDAQRYTQVFVDGRWIRLSPEVAFEYDPKNLMAPWRLTSEELDLEIQPLQCHQERAAIPPVLPFLIDVSHAELFVEMRGRIRVEGRWREVESLRGVMEEHHGRW